MYQVYLYITTTAFKIWSFGNINIGSGKEKDEGAKIYSITKETSENKKDSFYRLLNKACQKQGKN